MTAVAIIQGRMNASRLPGKVLLDLAGAPMLARVLARVRRARCLDDVLVATTAHPSDDPVEQFCRGSQVAFYRGDQFDVLDRYYQAALRAGAAVVVRITADCPVIDPALIDETIRLLEDASLDFACNRLPPPWKRTFPIGLDVEVCRFTALERAWHEAREKHQREHVMPYFYEGVQVEPVSPTLACGTSTRGFRIAQLNHVPDLGSLRWTVDTPEDLELMRRVFAHFQRDDFTWQDVLALQQAQPAMFDVNAGVHHKSAFDVDERQEKDSHA